MSEPSTIATKATAVATYTAGTSAVVFGLSANELAAYVGASVAVLTFVANLWFKWQHLKIVREAATKAPDCATCPERDV